MMKIISRVLVHTFLTTTSLSFFISLLFYLKENSLEGRQAVLIVLLISILLSIFNFICSLPALLNSFEFIRGNYILSALAFLGLPYFALVGMVLVFLNNPGESIELPVMLGSPFIISIILLTYHFITFRNVTGSNFQTFSNTLIDRIRKRAINLFHDF